jgi:ABC-type dipeptide/oligopeptide/nickel transport system ATPase component
MIRCINRLEVVAKELHRQWHRPDGHGGKNVDSVRQGSRHGVPAVQPVSAPGDFAKPRADALARQTRGAETIAAITAACAFPKAGEKYPGQLSGGQQQRGSHYARLVHDAKIMLFDRRRDQMVKEVLDTMISLTDDDMTMLCVTHAKWALPA